MKGPTLITDGALFLPGYAKNMPSLQSHQDTVCEVHLKVSSHRQSEAHACGLHVPGILAHSLSLTGMPGIPSKSLHFTNDEAETQSEARVSGGG